MNELALSCSIESLLVARNLRQMQLASAALAPGYYLRAAQRLLDNGERVLIGTGFPVAGTFETDGPPGAIALYDALSALGGEPWLACGNPLYQALESHYRVVPLTASSLADAEAEAAATMAKLRPTVVVAIEHPGMHDDGRYYNMRGEDISAACAIFDPFLSLAPCPTIAIGDGGNEVGMGRITEVTRRLDIRGARTGCDELLVADVSNWGAYGLVALLGWLVKRDLLADVSPSSIMAFLSARGSVDGVTRENTLTEDGLPLSECDDLILALRCLTGFASQLPPDQDQITR